MTDTQKDELYLDIDFRFSKIGEETVVNPHVTMQKLKSFIICKIEEAEKRGEEAINIDKVTRVEVIDHTKDFEEGGGRAYVNWKDTNKVELSFQDDERTLKVFISNQQDKQE